MKFVNEQSAAIIQVTFRDIYGNKVMPTSMTWKLDDAEGEGLIDTQLVIGLITNPYSIYVPGLILSILDKSHIFETKIVTITFIYGVDNIQGTEEYRFNVKRLAQIPYSVVWLIPEVSGGVLIGGTSL